MDLWVKQSDPRMSRALQTADYLYDRAWTFYSNCWYERALSMFEEAAALREEVNGRDDVGAIDALVRRLSEAIWLFELLLFICDSHCLGDV